MIRNVYLTLSFLLLSALSVVAQSGAIKGKIYDKATKEPLAFASVVAEMNGTQVGGAQSDFDGEYTIKPLQPGSYTIKVAYVGYNAYVINGVLVSLDKITFQDLVLSKTTTELKEVTVVTYSVPLIDKGNTQVGATITREEIAAAPTRDVKAVASTAAGVFQKDDGNDVNVRGARADGTSYYVDGIKVRNSSSYSQNLPQSGVEQVSVIVGGTPAQYGDATGGVISITTRGPSKDFSGGVEAVTSKLFDKYDYNLVSANLSGPIIKKKTASGGQRAVLGFFISGEYQYEKDPLPSAIGVYKVKDDIYNDIASHPITPYTVVSPTGEITYGAINRAAYLHSDAFEKSSTRNNIPQTGYRFTTKFDFQPLDNTTITIGGDANINDRRSFGTGGYNAEASPRYAFNFESNPNIIDRDYRGFIRLTQRIASTYKAEKEKSASVFRDVYFSIQAEYSKNQEVNQDPLHKGDFWAYGWNGSFHNNRIKTTTTSPVDSNGYTTNTINYGDNFSYASVGANPLAEAYNNIAYNFYVQNNAAGSTTFNDLNIITGPGGLRNGDSPKSIMSIFDATGTTRNLYQNFDNDQYRVSLTGSADIKKHAIRVGFEFEQRVDRGYSIAPKGLWTVGRAYANIKLLSGAFADTVGNQITVLPENYVPTLDSKGQVQNEFYENLRNGLHMGMNQYVDFDALTPSQLSVGYFTPDQLLTNNVLGYYYGYNTQGQKISGHPTFKDFYTKQENGEYTRDIGAFMPSYMAGYIQDNFAIDNLNFNIGVRVDRFDANQKQLKDKYLLLDAYNVGDLKLSGIPSNIGSNFIPYYATSTSTAGGIVGYRNGNVWYDPNGQIVSAPKLLVNNSSTGNLVPIVKTDAGSLATETWNIDGVFKDYDPQITIMPRVAFSFSITDQAQFFAHYDVLTQRPTDALRNDPIDYFNFRTNPDGTINNAGLKPERTTDYEVGFKQVLSKSSALTISAFYREMKNMIQITKLKNAFDGVAVDYTTYDNIDFGNVKGLSLTYDLRRTKNVRIMASYTLQFADGTGSGTTSNLELANTDQPNIRFITPLDFDTRHQITLSLDYRYGEGSEYNGPLLWGKPIFANTGANIIFKTNSGTPYSSQAVPTREGAAIGWQSNGQRVIEGVINSSRTPWQFRVDLKLDKDISIKVNDKKKTSVNVYIQVQNLLNTKNVINVYRATGNPNDDGFINSAAGQQLTATQSDPKAFVDQYNIKIQNPDNYSLPRRARIGVMFDF